MRYSIITTGIFLLLGTLGYAQSASVQNFRFIAQGSSPDGSTIIVSGIQSDLIEGIGGITGVGFLYSILLDNATTSLNDPGKIESFILFPNPVRSGGNLSLKIVPKEKISIHADLFALNGSLVARLIRSETIEGSWSSDINIGDIPSGAFVLLLRDIKGKTIAASKLIVQ